MRPRLISAVLFLLTIFVSSLIAETVVDISGQVRVRNASQTKENSALIARPMITTSYEHDWG